VVSLGVLPSIEESQDITSMEGGKHGLVESLETKISTLELLVIHHADDFDC
jgi:hypothetical protein